MSLQPTYYDFICKQRPFLAEFAEQDAQDLLALSHPPLTIQSVDDYDSRFTMCLKQIDKGILNSIAKQTGMSIDQIEPQLERALPQVRAKFASLYNTVNLEYHSLVNFALSGKKTFHFCDNLADHLVNTEINLKTASIQLPFSTCLFTFTARSVIDAMHNIRSNNGRLEINTAKLDYSAPVSVFLVIYPADTDLPARKLMICAWHAKQPNNSYLMLKRELFLGTDWMLEQALRTDWETLEPDNFGNGININSEVETITQHGDDPFYTDGLTFYRIILNAVLYLSSDQAELSDKMSPCKEIEDKAKDVTSLSKKRKLLQAIGRYTALDYHEVGSSVGPIVIKKEETKNSESKRNGSKPLVRFMVRGHWRRQSHGPESQSRKIIWIQPYYKGPDIAVTINKPYLVK